MVNQGLLLSRSEYHELPKLIWFLRGKKINKLYHRCHSIFPEFYRDSAMTFFKTYKVFSFPGG